MSSYFPVSVFDFFSHFILRNYNTDLSFLHAPTCNNVVIPSWFTVKRGKALGLVSPVKHWKDFTAVWHIQVSLSGSVKWWNRCSQSYPQLSVIHTFTNQDSWCNQFLFGHFLFYFGNQVLDCIWPFNSSAVFQSLPFHFIHQLSALTQSTSPPDILSPFPLVTYQIVWCPSESSF